MRGVVSIWRATRSGASHRRGRNVTISARQPPADKFNALIEPATLHASEPTPIKGVLAGRTIAMKDNIVTVNAPTTAASKALDGYTSPFDASLVHLLKENGARIYAKTNLDEFGMGSHSQISFAGPVQSPSRREDAPLSPGGSSGGSAVAVATGQCWAAIGTDTGGSVRLPAAYTGVAGFKPSYGLVSRWGVIQYANSLDTVGILAQKTEDIRAVFGVINQFDPQDPTSISETMRTRLGQQEIPAKSLRIGIPVEYNIAELSPVVRSTYSRVLQSLQSMGHSLHAVSLPSTSLALSAYYVLAPAEASSNLAKYDGIRYGHRTESADAAPKAGLPLYAQTRAEAYGPEVKRRILLGSYTLSSEAIDNYFIQAQRIRRLVQKDFDHVFALANPLLEQACGVDGVDQVDQVDVLLTPTAPTLAPSIDEIKRQSSVETYTNDVFTVPASLAGLPAASVPVRIDPKMKPARSREDASHIGVQVMGQFGSDELVLRVAELVENLR